MSTKTISLKELRPQLPKVMETVDKKMDRFVVTKRGHSIAVIMSPDDLEGLLETLEILQDKACLDRLKKARREVEKGETYRLEDIRPQMKRV